MNYSPESNFVILYFTMLHAQFLELTSNPKSSSKRLHTWQFPGTTIVDGVSGHKVGQQSRVTALHARKRSIIQSSPWTVNDSNTRMLYYLPEKTEKHSETSEGKDQHWISYL